jgi:DNA (cytosine-5)-methyltransferase 1
MFMPLRFIDLFAGIGGFRLGLESHGDQCVFSSEWDIDSQATYDSNFGEVPFGDITKIEAKTIPDHDVLCGGFPCQAFSVSGKQRGFEDSRGTLFYDILRIAQEKKPKVIFLENVRNLIKHDAGNTMEVIMRSLSDLGYKVFFKTLRSSDFGVPQARQRVYIVAFRNDLGISKFDFPVPTDSITVVKDVLERGVDSSAYEIKRPDISLYGDESAVPDPRKPHQIGIINKGGQGERIYSVNAAGITLSAYGGGAASKTGAFLVDGKVRKLTPRECARLQGFPESFTPHPKARLAYKQFGDSVSVPVIQAIYGQIRLTLEGLA